MSVRAVLLRLFLIVVLVGDGMGVAAAAAWHMGHVVDAAGVAAQSVAPSTSATSHETCHESTAAVASGEQGGPADVVPDGELQSSEECCDPAGCGACVHPCPALVHVIAFNPAWATHSQNVRALTSAHAPPPLLHLIRPPIA